MKPATLITLLFFLIAETLLLVWLKDDLSRATQESLDTQQSELATGLESVVNSHQKLVELALHHLISHSELLPLMAQATQSVDEKALSRIRGEIYRRAYHDYEELRSQDVRVLQFVLPDGRSFLRFNRPDLYNDVISDDRPLLAEVIDSSRALAGFENGRVYPGFHYAFPLVFSNQLVGVADFGLSYDGIRREFQATSQATGGTSRLLLRRDLVESVAHSSARSLFLTSSLNSDYVVENPASPLKHIAELRPLPDWIGGVDEELRNSKELRRTMSRGDSYREIACLSSDACYGVAMQPVFDSGQRPAAFVVAYTAMPEFVSTRHRLLLALVTGTALILLTCYLMNRWLSSRDRLKTINEHMGEGMYVMDRAGRIIFSNPAASRILGFSAGELKGENAHELFHSLSHGRKTPTHECPIRLKPLNGEMYQSYRESFRRKDGTEFTVSVTSSPLRERGKVSGAIVLFRDISNESLARERLRRANAALRQLAEGVLIADVNNRIVAVNEAFVTITGYSDTDVIGKTPAILKSGRQDAAFYASMWQTLSENGYWEGEVWNRRKNGEVYPEWLKITAMTDHDDQPSGYVAVFSDITEKRKNEQRLQHLAYRDQLTGMHNRTSFMEITEYALNAARRHDRSAALLFLDLDRFKRINDTFGHTAGDALLEQVAGRLLVSLREQDVVARIGGDEFVILVDEVADAQATAHVANTVLAALQQPFDLEGHKVVTSASIGISVFPQHGNDCDTLLKNADAAMYLAKQRGRDQYQHFVQGMDSISLERFELEQELRAAIANQELVLHYQPKVELPSGRVYGMEALIRWPHHSRGMLAPGQFINIAEEAGLMPQLTEQVILMATLQCAEWIAAGHEDICVSVNLDAEFFRRQDAERVLIAAVGRAGISPENLELEIIETAILKEAHFMSLWSRLTDLGFVISIDDFGKGESSLSRLKTIPVGILKIDRDFVSDLEHDEDDRAIVRTIVAMAKTLDKDVVAEGVENEFQLRFLYDSGCRAIQGYYFAAPASQEKATRFLQPGWFAAQARFALPAKTG